jgi:hypothetical protein
LLVESLHFVFGFLHDPFQCAQVARGSTLVEEINIDMFRYWVLALVDSFEESRLATTVLTEETISATVGKFEGGIGDENSAVENQGARSDLDVSTLLEGAENTSSNTIGETMLVHLVCQSLHFVHLLSRCRGLFIVGERVSIAIEEGWCLVTGD